MASCTADEAPSACDTRIDRLLTALEASAQREERLVRALEGIVQIEQRRLSSQANAQARAQIKTGPTTPEAMAHVRAKFDRITAKKGK